MSIAVDRNELNEILYNGMLTPAQFAAPAGTADYVEGAPEKWTEYDVDEANRLLDGIDLISKELNADGYRTFVGGANDGKAVTIEVETCADSSVDAPGVALLAQYYKAIGIQMVEVSNTDNNARNEKYYVGDVAMASFGGNNSAFNVMLRPDALAANRNNVCFVGKYALEHEDHLTPEPGTPMAELVDASKALTAANTIEEQQAAARRIVQSHYENAWSIGFVVGSASYTAMNNRVHNVREGFVWCDELRFNGYNKPYTWFIQ